MWAKENEIAVRTQRPELAVPKAAPAANFLFAGQGFSNGQVPLTEHSAAARYSFKQSRRCGPNRFDAGTETSSIRQRRKSRCRRIDQPTRRSAFLPGIENFFSPVMATANIPPPRTDPLDISPSGNGICASPEQKNHETSAMMIRPSRCLYAPTWSTPATAAKGVVAQ